MYVADMTWSLKEFACQWKSLGWEDPEKMAATPVMPGNTTEEGTSVHYSPWGLSLSRSQLSD